MCAHDRIHRHRLSGIISGEVEETLPRGILQATMTSHHRAGKRRDVGRARHALSGASRRLKVMRAWRSQRFP